MTEDNKVEDNSTHQVFICTISFFEPNGGPVRIIARDEAHARELLPQMLSSVRELRILDVVAEKDIHREPLPEEDPPKEVLH